MGKLESLLARVLIFFPLDTLQPVTPLPDAVSKTFPSGENDRALCDWGTLHLGGAPGGGVGVAATDAVAEGVAEAVGDEPEHPTKLKERVR